MAEDELGCFPCMPSAQGALEKKKKKGKKKKKQGTVQFPNSYLGILISISRRHESG